MYRFDATLPVLLRSDSTASASTSGAVDGARELDLWHRIASGDIVALQDLYRAHHRTVRAFAQRLLGDVQAAEDLVQEVFLAVPKAARNFRQETSPTTYLLGIAANHARNHIRAAKRRRSAAERLASHDTSSARTVSPDDEVHAARLVERLMKAVDQLPDKLRVVFILCQVEERDATEVSAILRVPPATVRSRLLAARSRLQSITSWYSSKELT